MRVPSEAGVGEDGDYVLYWMIANRRYDYNYSLERAVEWAKELGKPLLIFEARRVGYRWAAERFHAFVIAGMRDNAERFSSRSVTDLAYLECEAGQGSGLLEALSRRACVVVTDDFPAFFLPKMIAAAAERLPVRLEVIDGNGLLPMRATDKVLARAHDFRRHLQRTMPEAIYVFPKQDPLRGAELPMLEGLPKAVARGDARANSRTLRCRHCPSTTRLEWSTSQVAAWRGEPGCESFSRPGLEVTLRTATSPMWKPPAACLRTCTSASTCSMGAIPARTAVSFCVWVATAVRGGPSCRSLERCVS